MEVVEAVEAAMKDLLRRHWETSGRDMLVFGVDLELL
jgi:hypothetical protein